jgi:glycosyltransferase involved in cell wall biosynthesis
MVEVSVVIPTRDRADLLMSRALRSALLQEDVELEIVVVDDGSVDGTSERLRAIGDRRLRIVRREQSGGISRARNDGIAAARGEWIALLDDDDLWSPSKLRVQLTKAREEGADLVYGGAVAVNVEGEVLSRLYLPEPDELPRKLDRACVIPAGCSNVVLRTEAIRRVGGFDERLANLADWDLWLRLVGPARVAVCEEVLVAYVLHDGNMHVVADPTDELDYLIRKHAASSPPRLVEPDRAGYGRWVAAQRSRAGRRGEAARAYLRTARTMRTPGDLLRAADALAGKRASSALRSLRKPETAQVPAPEWLARYVW